MFVFINYDRNFLKKIRLSLSRDIVPHVETIITQVFGAHDSKKGKKIALDAVKIFYREKPLEEISTEFKKRAHDAVEIYVLTNGYPFEKIKLESAVEKIHKKLETSFRDTLHGSVHILFIPSVSRRF